MIAKAEGKFLRVSPSKARIVADLVRGKDVTYAQGVLLHLNQRSKEYMIKILKSAVANAKVKGISADRLYISKIVCDVGPMWKRFKAAAFGRASSIVKRTVHIKIELDLKSDTPR
ncbi:MAG: 50S ribosomal protein L22 [Candidatus Omnitrophota bacterium]